MNGRISKKIRRIVRKNDLIIAKEFKVWVNSLPFRDRVRLAWKALWRTM